MYRVLIFKKPEGKQRRAWVEESSHKKWDEAMRAAYDRVMDDGQERHVHNGDDSPASRVYRRSNMGLKEIG